MAASRPGERVQTGKMSGLEAGLSVAAFAAGLLTLGFVLGWNVQARPLVSCAVYAVTAVATVVIAGRALGAERGRELLAIVVLVGLGGVSGAVVRRFG
jgi:hypothetical protein